MVLVMNNAPAGMLNEEFEAAKRRFGSGRPDEVGRKARSTRSLLHGCCSPAERQRYTAPLQLR